MSEPLSQTQPDATYLEDVCRVIRQTLQLGDDTRLALDTALLGAIPEFDSMSVVTILTELEELFDFVVDEDDISAETFESVGTLLRYVQASVAD